MDDKKKDKEGLFKSIFTAYFILLFHVFLIAGIGLIVVLFKGVYHYFPWILGGIGLLVVAVFWIIYRHMKKNTSELKDILDIPEFKGRTVEIRLLGGLASFKIEANNRAVLTGHESDYKNAYLIETYEDQAERKILALKSLYEKNLISEEEFQAARQRIIM